MTQETLGGAAGINTETVSRIETGALTPSLPTLVALARALDVPAGLLVEGRADDAAEAELIALWRAIPDVAGRSEVIEHARHLVPRASRT